MIGRCARGMHAFLVAKSDSEPSGLSGQGGGVAPLVVSSAEGRVGFFRIVYGIRIHYSHLSLS